MLFGVEAPKMIVNIDTTQDEILLDYSVILKDEPELDTYGVKAVRTGKQVFTNAGKHWIFEVKIHLWKYGDPKAKYLELKSYEGTDVYLYRHADGEPIYDTYDNKGRFVVESVNEFYTDEFNKYDYLIITFRSKKFINKSFLYTPPEEFTPDKIAELDVWFSDDTLSNPSSNNFVWVDKVSNVITLEGSFGSGTGIMQVNGKNVLHTKDGDYNYQLHLNGFTNAIVKSSKFTFAGIIQVTYQYDNQIPSYACHDFLNNAQFALCNGAGWAGAPPYAKNWGLYIRGTTAYSNVYDFYAYQPAEAIALETPPMIPTILVITYDTDNDIVNVRMNGTVNVTSYNSIPANLGFVNYCLTGRRGYTLTGPLFRGILGEFMYYNKVLSDYEITQLAQHLSNKYDIQWGT